MPLQERAENTRLSILKAAAEVFTESDYGSVAMTEVIERSGVPRGTFGYHFPTKESLAAALIAHADAVMTEKAAESASESSSTLENLIRSTFAMENLSRRDVMARIGTRLFQILNHLSDPQEWYWDKWLSFVTTAIEQAVAEGDLNSDVDTRKVGYVLLCGLTGNSLIAESLGMDSIEGLALLWRASLRAIVSPESAPFFDRMVQRVAAIYTAE